MVVSTTGILLYAEVSPLYMHYGSALLLCNLVANMVVMKLGLRQSWMFITTKYYHHVQKYNLMYCEVCFCLHIK